jgi:hypothetical protein
MAHLARLLWFVAQDAVGVGDQRRERESVGCGHGVGGKSNHDT